MVSNNVNIFKIRAQTKCITSAGTIFTTKRGAGSESELVMIIDVETKLTTKTEHCTSQCTYDIKIAYVSMADRMS